jgi:hypothetical protein
LLSHISKASFQFHDILYTLFRDMLYTSARAQASAEVDKRCQGAAHPPHALEISPENVSETMEYTAELLRFLYIEPYEFEQRKARNIPKP